MSLQMVFLQLFKPKVPADVRLGEAGRTVGVEEGQWG